MTNGKGNILTLLFKKLFKSIAFQDKINFARHLSVTIKSGLPILEALRLIQRQSASKRFVRVLETIIGDVNNGQSLAQALERFHYIFGDFFINIVRVGETSGNLSPSLLQISQELKRQRDILRRVRGAMVYPVVILVVTLGIVIFLTVFIFPKILPIFVSLKIQLPLTTRIIIFLLSFLSQYGFYVLGGLVVLVVGLRVLVAIPVVHFFFDRLLLSIPIFSRVIINLTLASFARSLSVLLRSGMTIIDALNVSKGTFHNLYYRRHIERLIEVVKKGEEMAKYLVVSPKFFPPMFVGMIEVGENTGNLDENLVYLSEYYESEVEETVKNLTTILEPLLLVVMGLVVGFVALSIITPIYKITQELKVGS